MGSYEGTRSGGVAAEISCGLGTLRTGEVEEPSKQCEKILLGALRARKMAKWPHRYRIEWDATDGRNRGTQRTVWEMLLEFKFQAGEIDQGAVPLP